MTIEKYICTKCGVELPASCFYYYKRKSGNLSRVTRCKPCESARFQERAKTRVHKKRENIQKATPNKINARQVVQYALRVGKVKKPPCATCDNPKSQAHHFAGYAGEHRRRIVWLCRAHHAAWHRIFLDDDAVELSFAEIIP